MPAGTHALFALARLYHVLTDYTDVTGRRRPADPESLLAVLRALGAPLQTAADVPEALHRRRLERWQRGLEPVVVAWDGRPAAVALRLPAGRASGKAACLLEAEGGAEHRWAEPLGRLTAAEEAEVEGARFVRKGLKLPGHLPPGRHRLTVEAGGRSFTATVVSAPRKAPTPAEGEKAWGLFAPVYALRSQHGWGAGDFSDLGAFVEWSRGRGARIVATLPVLAGFLEEPCEPSPYAPVSRRFWNEFYVDVTSAPELADCPAAQALLASPEYRRELRRLRSADHVDYCREMGLKRRVLQELARTFFARKSPRRRALEDYLRTHPDAEDYARFRAACVRRQAPWPDWPARLRDGALRAGDYDEEVRKTYLYAQWLAHTQMAEVARNAREIGSGLYLDLPVGVHPHGYDTWRERNLFAPEVTVGAPPDGGFPGGQDWGFVPLDPERVREDGYRYVAASLRHHAAHARLLRIDHVMGLHRLFWIPRGHQPADGVYVRYPADELYAVLSLEAHRHGCGLVGEDLGTVPPCVGPAMSRHNAQRMYVLQYELDSAAGGDVRAPGRDCVASVNTHDMPPFAAYWDGKDVEYRHDLGLMDAAYAEEQRQQRQVIKQRLLDLLRREGWLANGSADVAAILRACLAYLAAGPARVTLLNVEDLWLEDRPQNVPGTSAAYPNWRHKLRHSLPELGQDPRLLEVLREVDELRTGGRDYVVPSPRECLSTRGARGLH